MHSEIRWGSVGCGMKGPVDMAFKFWKWGLQSWVPFVFELGELVAVRPLKGTFAQMSYHCHLIHSSWVLHTMFFFSICSLTERVQQCRFLPASMPIRFLPSCSFLSVSLLLWGVSLWQGQGLCYIPQTPLQFSKCLLPGPSATAEIFAQVDMNVLHPPHPPFSFLFRMAHHCASSLCLAVRPILAHFFPLHLFYHVLLFIFQHHHCSHLPVLLWQYAESIKDPHGWDRERVEDWVSLRRSCVLWEVSRQRADN